MVFNHCRTKPNDFRLNSFSSSLVRPTKHERTIGIWFIGILTCTNANTKCMKTNLQIKKFSFRYNANLFFKNLEWLSYQSVSCQLITIY